MPINYLDMTGVLVLKTVTPVIHALFGRFQLNPLSPGNGEAYIAQAGGRRRVTWKNVLDDLLKLADSLLIIVPPDSRTQIAPVLNALSEHFNTDCNFTAIKLAPLSAEAELAFLFLIATAFDDGHGLSAIKSQAALTCAQRAPVKFGGHGEFIGRHCRVMFSASQANELGGKLDCALQAGNIEEAAWTLTLELQRLLERVNSDEDRRDLKTYMETQLRWGTSRVQFFGVLGRIPGDELDTFRVFVAATRAEALASFETAMWQGKSIDQREALRKQHGFCVVVNAVFMSENMIIPVHS